MGFFTREPALWIEVIRTGLLMAILFGLHLTTDQFGAVMVFIGAVALALVRSQVTPQAPANVDDLKKYIGKAEPAVIDKAGVHIVTTNRTIALLIGFMLLGATVAQAEDPGLLSMSRLSAGPRAVAQVYDFDSGAPREVGFVAGAAASWNLTSRWDVDGSIERKFNAGELVAPHWRSSAGLHVLLPNSNEKQQWFLAFERAWYSGDKMPETGQWVARLQWSFGAQDKSGRDYGFAIVRGRYDIPDAEHEGRRDIGVGIQPQLIGGN